MKVKVMAISDQLTAFHSKLLGPLVTKVGWVDLPDNDIKQQAITCSYIGQDPSLHIASESKDWMC